MIISHTYKYLFVELPRTGTTAISQELCDLYEGKPILYKHATYLDFLRVATPEEKEYFVFTSIRNPLDDAVSLYYKYRNDHRHRFTKEKKLAKFNPVLRFLMKERFNFTHRSEVDFPAYFKRYYRIPYDNWSVLSQQDFDFVIRFENLQEDFARVLSLIGIQPRRPLPAVNATAGRSRDFLSYYTPDIRGQAMRVFGPYMARWGYAFPAEWGESALPAWNRWEYTFFNFFRTIYWRFFRRHFHTSAYRKSEQ